MPCMLSEGDLYSIRVMYSRAVVWVSGNFRLFRLVCLNQENTFNRGQLLFTACLCTVFVVNDMVLSRLVNNMVSVTVWLAPTNSYLEVALQWLSTQVSPTFLKMTIFSHVKSCSKELEFDGFILRLLHEWHFAKTLFAGRGLIREAH